VKCFNSASRHAAQIVSVLLLASLSFAQSQGQPATQSGSSRATTPLVNNRDDRQPWRKAMASALPKKAGCHKVSYPDTEWIEVQCLPPPRRTVKPPTLPLETVGNENDYVATVTSGTITSSEGSFPQVTNVTSEYNNSPGNPYFSLQLNSVYFSTAACDGGGSTCEAYEQFIYSVEAGGIYIQNWLIAYGPECPGTGDWTSPGPPNCVLNSSMVAVPTQAIADLGQLALMGTATSGGSDTALMYVGDTLYSVSESDSTLDLAANWTGTEFNVLGDTSGEAFFNDGATLVVKTLVTNGTGTAPSCSTGGDLGESNNLNLITPCCPFGGNSPGIIFMESNATGAATSCAVLKNSWLPAVLLLL
jgi:hypothetical protein